MMNETRYKPIPLGKETPYPTRYDPGQLVPVPRDLNRQALGIGENRPFTGLDLWNAYEISWLDAKGKPRVAIGELWFPATTDHIIESKSLKLYLNSFTQERIDSSHDLIQTLEKDLGQAAGGAVKARLVAPAAFGALALAPAEGRCIDELDLAMDSYQVHPDFLAASGPIISETLHSNLLKTNCPVTGQPDWATLVIAYSGPGIDAEGLLRYIVSYREHTGFHESCVEQIFMDLWRRCRPEQLTVYARFTRRGGIDINPYRSSGPYAPENFRLARQ
jgi:7-cyano-7-deazaguanine reductase